MSPRSLVDLPAPALDELHQIAQQYPDGHELRRLVAEIVHARARLIEMDELRERVQQMWSRELHALRLVALCNLRALLSQERRRVGAWPDKHATAAIDTAVIQVPRLGELRSIWYRYPKGHVARHLAEEIAHSRGLLGEVEALALSILNAWTSESDGLPMEPLRHLLLLLHDERKRFE